MDDWNPWICWKNHWFESWQTVSASYSTLSTLRASGSVLQTDWPPASLDDPEAVMLCCGDGYQVMTLINCLQESSMLLTTALCYLYVAMLILNIFFSSVFGILLLSNIYIQFMGCQYRIWFLLCPHQVSKWSVSHADQDQCLCWASIKVSWSWVTPGHGTSWLIHDTKHSSPHSRTEFNDWKMRLHFTATGLLYRSQDGWEVDLADANILPGQ